MFVYVFVSGIARIKKYPLKLYIIATYLTHMVGLAMSDNLSDGDTHRSCCVIMREWSVGSFQC